MTDTSAQNNIKRGFVKQVLSGDALVLQGPVQAGPPKEITVYLSYLAAPRIAKRPSDSVPGSSDEPYAWEAREFLRKKIVGKTVVFIRDFIATSGREHGRIYLGGTNVDNAENIGEACVKEGWLEVRPGKQVDESVQKLLTLQQEAKNDKRGRWAEDDQTHVRDIKWNIPDLRALVEKYKQQPIDAVVEQVRDGNSIRAFLLPTFEYVTVMFSGIKAPSSNNRDGRSEEYAEEAKFFVESRLLQRDVKIILESSSNQSFIGSVLHPTRGNIAEFLLKDGYAKCVEWSLNSVSGGTQNLREAERYAKEHKLRLWKNYVSNSNSTDRKTFTAKVIEIGLGDSFTVLKDNGEESKIYLSSVRPPRRETANEETATTGRQFRPLYDIPHMFEAREFLRKRIIGKRIEVTVDYIQPKSDQFPEKTCCTIHHNGQNLAEQLIENGLAKVVRHRQDDENRSPYYDSLINAEEVAQKAGKGLWNNSDKAIVRVNELQGDPARSKQFLSYLQRSTRLDCIVEFVASGSRLRVFVPKESCLITFLINSVSCPRPARVGPGGKLLGESEPYSKEALMFTKLAVLQHDVQIEVENMDKAGGFIGNMFVKNERGGQSNFAELLLEQGLATVHFAAAKTKYYNQLINAEERAKSARLNLWKNYVEEEETEKQVVNEPTERKLNLKKVLASAVYKGNLQFSAQNFSDEAAILSLMSELQKDLEGVNGAGYKPRRGELCACYDEHIKMWHRAKVESTKADRADILYIDFGNRENVSISFLAPLPKSMIAKQPLCREYKLALVQLPNMPEFAGDTDRLFEEILMTAPYLEVNIEYKTPTVEAVSVYRPSDEGEKIDVGKYLIENGLAVLEPRRESRFKDLIADYQSAESEARRSRLAIWRYGDFSGVDF